MGFNESLIEIAVGRVSSRGKIIPYSDLVKYINDKDELYRSMFILEDHCSENFTSIKDYNGMYKLKHIIFDIDRGQDSGPFTMDRTTAFIKTLISMGVNKEHIQIWFSGRGFHVEMPDYYGFEPSENLPQVVKQTLHKEFGNEIDNIYDKGRIIRVNHTINDKSKLYKTPLMMDEMENFSYDAVEDIASKFIRKDYQPEPIAEVKPTWKLRIEHLKAIVVEVKEGYVPHVVCVQKMMTVANNKGSRHPILLRMANSWRRSGIDQDGVDNLAKLYVPSLKAKERKAITKSVFSWEHDGYSCSDPIMDKYCDSRCRYYQYKNYGIQSMNTEMLAQKLKDFVLRDHEYSFDLADIYQLGFSYKFNPGELAIVIGDVKLGKTAWIQNLVVKTRHLKTLFLSLEVHAQLIFRRFIQIGNSMDKQTVYDGIRNDDIDMSSIKHISVLTKCDLDSLKDEILKQQAKLIVIDTLDGLEVKGVFDPFKKQERIAMSLKQMAQDLNVIIIGINHISKSAAVGLQHVPMLSVHSAKGNSALEQKADKMIGIEGQLDSVERRVRSLASRDESGFTLAFKFDRETMEFKQETL